MVKFNFNGWIILDKQKGVTSRHAVTKISKVLGVNKIGHGGTLDPLATGVLPIAIGEATKLISFIQNKNKKYSFTIKWGESTDTDDIEGNFLEKSDVRPNKNQINKALFSFIGKIFQKPPIFSAIKIDGKRSYNLARQNIIVEHKPRQIEVHDLKLKKIINNDDAEFEVAENATKGQIKNAFVKSLKIKKLNKKVLGEFISLVA